MTRHAPLLIAVLALLAPPAAAQTGPANPPQQSKGASVHRATHHDVSPPLRSIAPIPPLHGHYLPIDHELPEGINRPPVGAPQGRRAPNVVQTWQGAAAMPTALTNWAGLGDGFSGFSVSSEPPDTEGDVGPTYYIQWVNTSFAIFNKTTGAVAYGPAAGNTLWSGFGGGCETNNDGDPIVKYDQFAQRWVFTQFSVSSTPYTQCVAISQTSDPLGSYYRYSFSYGSSFNDYGKMGVWPDGYYITYNMFGTSSFLGGEVCAFDRAAMLAGTAATEQCFGPYSAYGGWLPSDVDGPDAPPSGAPNYVLAFDDTGSNLLLWKFHVDWTTPANSTFTGPTTVAVASFSPACGGGTCIPTPGNDLDSLADRLMFRLAYRNFVGDHESLVVNHSITGSSATSAVRWYELRDPGGTPTVYQSGTYEPDSTSRWMGSIAMDHVGNMALGYSLSDSSTDPSIYWTGRLAGDTLGQMTQAESVIVTGTGTTTGRFNGQSLSRWGDYSSMSVDPTDDCTFWYTQEYKAADGQFNWRTQIASFKYTDCHLCDSIAPTGLTASTPSGIDNQIDLSWNRATNATEYHVYRATTSGGPYSQVDTVPDPGSGTTVSYSDTTVSANVPYYYVVRSYGDPPYDCESGDSNEDSATATGACTAAPTFAGITSATSGSDSTCAIDLAWSAASAPCGGPVSYSVYRSTSSGFTPAPDNRIATGLSGTSYSDGSGLAAGTTYYYIVHATDEGNGQEDTNTAEASSAPFASLTPSSYSDDVESGAAPETTAGSNWSIQTCAASSGTHSWHMGQTDCTGIPKDGGAYSLVYTLTLGADDVLGQASFNHTFAAYSNASYTDRIYFEIDPTNSGTYQTIALWQASDGTWSTMTGAGPYDLSGYNSGHATTVKFRFRFQSGANWIGSNSAAGWNVDDFTVTYDAATACSSTPGDVDVLTTTAYPSQNIVEWLNPPNTGGGYGSTQIQYRTDQDPTGPADGTTLATQAGTADSHDSATQTGLSGSGLEHYYGAWVNTASDASGTWSSPGKTVAAAPNSSIAAPLDWAYSTDASALSSPRRAFDFPGVYIASNDRRLHAMTPGQSGGVWPTGWKPAPMNAPAELPPFMLTVDSSHVNGLSSSGHVAFSSSLDGRVYAFDADTGTELWSSQVLGMLSASPAIMDTGYGGSWNLVIVGTRDAAADNKLCALNMSDGSTAWCFDNGGGSSGIGIISGPALVDTSWTGTSGEKRAFFASRARTTGSSGTVWCVKFTDTTVSLVWNDAIGDIDGAPTFRRPSSDPATWQVVVGTNDSYVYVVDPADGSTVSGWPRSFSDGPVKEFVASDSTGTRLYFSTDGTVWSIPGDGSTGDDWAYALSSPSRPLPVYGTDSVLVGGCSDGTCTDGELVQLDSAQSWASNTTSVTIAGSGQLGGPTVDQNSSPNTVHVGSATGRVYTASLPLP